MKEINKKGFTMVEILIVIVIIGILVSIATLAITKYMDQGKDTYNHKLKSELVLAGKSYYSDHKDKLPTKSSIKSYDYITLPEMKDGRYLTNELVDSEGRDCSDSYVYVRQTGYDSTDYEYIGCLVCKDSKGNEYHYDEKNDPHCNISMWTDQLAPTCSHKENDYDDSPAADWTIKDAADDYGISYVIIRNKNSRKNYYAIDVKDKSVNEIRNINIKEEFKKNMDVTKVGDYETILLDQGGNESRNSCLDFSIIHDACTIDWSGSNVIIKQATSKKGFKEIYYVTNNTTIVYGNVTGKKITNQTLTGIPQGSDIYIRDIKGNSIPCDVSGVPVCEFIQTPGSNKYISKNAELKVRCTITEGEAVKKEVKVQVKDLSKIVPDASKNLGKINVNDITHNGGAAKKAYELIITIPYVANPSVNGTETVTFGAGTVRNAKEGYENKVNRAISTSFKVDSMPPVITYTANGQLGNATALTDKGQGYYNTVTITATCTDTGSPVASFKINNATVTNPYSITFSQRGIYNLQGECTDSAGNKSNKTGGPYRVLKQVTDCAICGIKKYKSCPSEAICGCK